MAITVADPLHAVVRNVDQQIIVGVAQRRPALQVQVDANLVDSLRNGPVQGGEGADSEHPVIVEQVTRLEIRDGIRD